MRKIIVDNYELNKQPLDIIYDIQRILTNGKLRDIKVNHDNIVVSCVNRNHNNGKEKNPDMNIYIGDDSNIKFGYARCFACGWHGDFINFVAEAFEKPVQDVKNWLIECYGVKIGEKIDLGPAITLNSKKQQTFLDPQILDKYQSWHPYLASRGISRDVATDFNIKYNNKNNSIIFPCYNKSGKLVMTPTRNIDSKIFYLDSGKEKPVYGIDKVYKNNIKTICAVEGPIDLLCCYTNNVPAIAFLGAISDEQIAEINKSPISVVYLMCDNDEAGRRFNNILKKKLAARILTVDVKFPANKKDPGELTKDDWDKLKKQYNLPQINLKKAV